MIAFETMQKYYRERCLAAREWKRKGGRVVAYFGNEVPEELILAAELFPLRITGNPLSGGELADRYMEYYFDVQVRSMYNEILKGVYDFADMIIIPHSSDSVLRLYYWLWEEKRINEAMPFVRPYLFDKPHTVTRGAGLYMLNRVRALKQRLEQFTGLEISSESLLQAIALTNENRMLLRKVADLRTATPPRISGTEALQIIGASLFMQKEEHNKLLRQFLQEAEQLPAKGDSKVRLFISGSTVDNLQFYELVEFCNAVIIAEDVDTGNRYFDGLIDTSLDPLEAIANRYWLLPSPQTVPMAIYSSYVLEKIKSVRPQGVIFNYLQWDDAPAWHYPDLKSELDKMGIPHLVFEFQEYLLAAPQRLKTRIEAFIESIGDR
jgi:benzoyl-CoA reductase/2-hydroxyglutaryl-CoA dehydratase subunit BcrC/BadD/HgdB